MGVKSTVYRLPPEIRERIAELRRDGMTIDEILNFLKNASSEVSRSALGRHIKHLDEVNKYVHDSRIVAESLAKSFGDSSDGKVNRANIEILHTLLMRAMMEMTANGGKLEIDDLMKLAIGLQKTVQASRDDASREKTLREEEQKKAAVKVEKVGKKQGISAEIIELMKKEIIGA